MHTTALPGETEAGSVPRAWQRYTHCPGSHGYRELHHAFSAHLRPSSGAGALSGPPKRIQPRERARREGRAWHRQLQKGRREAPSERRCPPRGRKPPLARQTAARGPAMGWWRKGQAGGGGRDGGTMHAGPLPPLRSPRLPGGSFMQPRQRRAGRQKPPFVVALRAPCPQQPSW